MSRLDPPQVLVERTALAVLRDPDDDRHAPVLAAYLDLVEQYRNNQVLLVALADDLTRDALAARRGLFAPVDILHIGGQHRRAAAKMHTDPVDPAFALTLVMCQRYKVRRLLTLDPRFLAYDVTVEGGLLDDGPDGIDGRVDSRADGLVTLEEADG